MPSVSDESVYVLDITTMELVNGADVSIKSFVTNSFLLFQKQTDLFCSIGSIK